MRSFIIRYEVLKLLTIITVVCISWTIAAAETDVDMAENDGAVVETDSDMVEAGSDVGEIDNNVAETDTEDSEEKTALPDLVQRMKKRIFIDVNELSIDTVIRQLAEQADMDIIISPNVIGNVTVTLTDVPLEEAMNNILAVHDCTYVLTNNMMRIITSEEMVAKAEPILTKTYEIVYIDAAQVAEALDKFKSSQGSVSSIKGTSHIIVTDTESKIREITSLLEKIDRVTPQILVEARIYDITSRDKLDLGVQWDVGQRTDFSEALGGANPTDEISPFTTGKFRGQTNEASGDTVGALRFGWLNPNLDIDVLLRAEKEITEAKLLANPRILVLDNETALFDIVTEHPYVERTISSGDITESVKFKEVGVKLVVTPHVTRDGMIRLRIQPEFGVFVERVTLSTTDVPVVDTRKVDTIALIKDGQTVVLGGMRKKGVTKLINKIPLLGDIPILGGLFRFEGESTSVTELVVFITPRIILEQPVLSLDEQLALDETNFSRPEPSSTRAEKKAAEK